MVECALTLKLEPKRLLLNLFDDQTVGRYTLYVKPLFLHAGRYFSAKKLLSRQPLLPGSQLRLTIV